MVKYAVVANLLSAFMVLSSLGTTTAQIPSGSIPGYSESAAYQPRKVDKIKPRSGNKAKPPPLPTTIAPRTPSETFTVPVAVYDSQGQVVNDLKQADFTVFMGEEESAITAFEVARAPINVVFLIDTSPSADLKYDEIGKLAALIIRDLAPRDRVMVVQFNENLKVLTDFTSDRKLIEKGFQNSKMGDGTSLYDSIDELFRTRLEAVEGPLSIILFSDGIDTTSERSDYSSSLVEAEKIGSTVFPVYFDTTAEMTSVRGSSGLTQSALLAAIAKQMPMSGKMTMSGTVTKEERLLGLSYLNELARLSGGVATVYPLKKADPLSISRRISASIKHQYLLTIRRSATPVTGDRLPLRVRVDRPGLTVLSKSSYFYGS